VYMILNYLNVLKYVSTLILYTPLNAPILNLNHERERILSRNF
jgi:hypothetical protein